MKPKAPAHYQNILRAIGQGLETLEAISFDLEVSDNHYEVRGECKKPVAAMVPKASLKNHFSNWSSMPPRKNWREASDRSLSASAVCALAPPTSNFSSAKATDSGAISIPASPTHIGCHKFFELWAPISIRTDAL
ncbi:MAG: hypothetical protein EXR70_15775 [Deltaproteobacteria bacterium]|nr:hypothetical protein [Deltaproteobacteria bacterium]